MDKIKILPLSPSPYSLVYKILPLEDLTPAQAYEALNLKSPSFLLESVKGSPQTARYSFIGDDPFLIFKSKEWDIELTEGGIKKVFKAHPIKELKKLMGQFSAPHIDGLPPFIGGAVGCVSYDACHFFENLPARALDDLNFPDLYFVFIDKAVIFDHQEKQIWILASDIKQKDLKFASNWVEDTCHKLSNPQAAKIIQAEIGPSSDFESNFTQRQFEEVVSKAKEYIKAGDIFQVNLSQRLQCPINGDYWELYKILRKINPSPFACYLEGDDFTVVSCSPERLVRLRESELDTRPIAGTRPRGRDRGEDKALSAELLLNEKERAEHIMLVDLERNDLGRICEYGSVHVDELMVLEDYSHVFHIVSNVAGKLLKGKDAFSVIRAAFPGGTITGAPKIRSMEIIDELEPTRRGLYTGSIGYLSFSGNMDLNIVIRTFLIKNNTAYIQVGCGIVADSVPEREYHETLHKAAALLQTLRLHISRS